MRRTQIAAVALGVVLLFDALRAWLPSVIFIYGRAGTTPATEMGLFAAIPFLLAFAAALAVRLAGARAVTFAAGGVLVALRVVLQATDGGDAQLWAATAAVVAGLSWLVGTAAASTGPVAAVGVVAGLAADAGIHALLRSAGILWQPGVSPWLLVLALCGAFVLASLRAVPEALDGGSASGWVAVGGALVVHAIVSMPVSRLHAITDWPEAAAVAVVATGHALAVLVAAVLVVERRGFHGPVAALALIVALLAALAGGPALAAVGTLVLPVALGASLACALTGRGSGASARAVASAGGLLLFVALAFGYYAAYDMVLAFPSDVMVVVAGGVVALVALRTSSGVPRDLAVVEGPDRRMGARAGGVLIAVVALTVAAVATAAAPGEARPGPGYPLRVVNYNLQMGFDIDGRQSVADLAVLIGEQEPDVVGLQEVSRGWLINASVDTLPPISEHLGMPFAFAPAADRVWGNAVLSRYPVVDVGDRLLPRDTSAMQRGVQWVVLDLGADGELAVVNTHLQHVAGQVDVRRAQAEVVASAVRDHLERGREVVLLGDMNVEPGAEELQAYDGLLTEVSASEGPIATHPSWDPQVHIDHVYVSDGLRGFDVVVPDSTASDHLAVVVTIDRR